MWIQKVPIYSYPNNWRWHLLLLLTRIILPSTFWNQNSSKVLKILKCLEISTFFCQRKQNDKRVLSEFTKILFEVIKILEEFRSENRMTLTQLLKLHKFTLLIHSWMTPFYDNRLTNIIFLSKVTLSVSSDTLISHQ